MFMARKANIKIPNLKYHNKRSRLWFRDHVNMTQEVLTTMQVAQSMPTE